MKATENNGFERAAPAVCVMHNYVELGPSRAVVLHALCSFSLSVSPQNPITLETKKTENPNNCLTPLKQSLWREWEGKNSLLTAKNLQQDHP